MRGWHIIAAAALVAGAAAPAAAAMDVNTFLAKVAALKAKGPMALFSPDIGVLKREAADATATLQADTDARKKAGKPLLYCVPERAKRMSQSEMLDGLAAIPPARRTMSVKDGFATVLARKYPCLR